MICPSTNISLKSPSLRSHMLQADVCSHMMPLGVGFLPPVLKLGFWIMHKGKREGLELLVLTYTKWTCIVSQFLSQLELTFHFSFLPVSDKLLVRDSSQPNRLYFAFTGLKGIKPIMLMEELIRRVLGVSYPLLKSALDHISGI